MSAAAGAAPDTGCDVFTLGEPMVMFVARQPGPLEGVADFTRYTAGAELNVATGLARLGLQVRYLTRLGRDSFGRFLHEAIRREGIDTRHVQLDGAHPTGFMLKTLAHGGADPAVEYFRRGSAASQLGPQDLPGDVFARTRHLHLTGITPALSASARALAFEAALQARQGGCSISFDPNLRPRLWASEREMTECLNRLAACCDWLLPGLEEGRRLTGEATPEGIADFYLARGAKLVAIKLGPEGAFFATPDQSGRVPGVRVENVVDTVGAGDAFAVGLVSALLEGLPAAAAVARGNAIGARVVQFPGDSDGLPTRTQLELMTAAPA